MMRAVQNFVADAARQRASVKHSSVVDPSVAPRYEVRTIPTTLGPRHRAEEGRQKWLGQFRRVGWAQWLTIARHGRANGRFDSQDEALLATREWLRKRGLPI